MEHLIATGYIEEAVEKFDKRRWFSLTEKGRRLAQASIGDGIPRATALRLLHEFLDRCDELNRDSYWLYRVVEVKLFGSLLIANRPRVGDIDIAPKIERKPDYMDTWDVVSRQRVAQAWVEGRSFQGCFEELCWPERETRLYLRQGSRYLNFHDDDPLLERQSVRQEQIYKIGKGRLISDGRARRKPVARRTDPFSGRGPLIYPLEYALQWGHTTSAVLMPSDKIPAVLGPRGTDLSNRARRALTEGIKSIIAKGELPPFPFKWRRTASSEGGYHLDVEIPSPLAARVRAAWRKHRAERLASVADARSAP